MNDHTPLAGRRPRLLGGTTVYRGRSLTLRVDTLRLPNGNEVEREVVHHPGAVVIAALNLKAEVAVVEQYRHAIGAELHELPAGTLEEGEQPLAAAKRELAEEAGIQAARWDHLGHFYSSPGFVHEKLYAFLARDLKPAAADPDEDEDIEVEWVPLTQAAWGEEAYADAKTLATLLLVEALLRREEDARH